ncbi:MAG: tripartite tricarboxylate transporter substrate binding protein [Betaproteobacteria bacterium]|jgi:tripartite-type tricarboxylate transporter receptor subunit TctC|nr:tripartite tricarboxylate transporter substrate binding protein [Betaproteobacteria bacterium]MDH5343226.1 tripartite tricarboxylate transporter substrate binding protein [Betaproteobacteria bacterium]
MRNIQLPRTLLYLASVVAFLASNAVLAQGYPDRPVRIIVPFSAGGPNDILARAVGMKLGERLGQQVIVDNRPGGGTVIGTDIAAHSPADGYTLLMASTSHSVNPTLKKNLPYDQKKDLDLLILMADAPNLAVVHPSLPVKSIKDLIALAKSHPGEIAYSSGGVGASTHLAGASLSSMAGIKMIHVAYKGGAPATRGLIGGEVAWMFGTFLPTIPHVRAGRLRVIATGGTKRTPVLPKVAAVAETVPGFKSVGWWGMMLPKGVPQPIVVRLNREINTALNDLREQFLRDGTEVIGGTPADFQKFFDSEVAKWAGVIKSLGIKPN